MFTFILHVKLIKKFFVDKKQQQQISNTIQEGVFQVSTVLSG